MFSKINLQILSPKERALLKEVSNENLSKVKTLVSEENVNVNIRDTLKRSPLMRAPFIEEKEAREGITSLFIENGAEVNMVDLHGKSALMMACREEGKEDMVKLLMECTRTDPNLQDEDGNTALIQAIEVENVPVVRTLLTGDYSHRVDVNVDNFDSNTAIVVATKLRNEEICVLLASTGHVDLSKVPKHLLNQMPAEAKREVRNSKSRLSRTKSNDGTPTSRDAPYSFSNQISPSSVSKTFTIPPPIPDQDETPKEETSLSKVSDDSPPENDQTNAEKEVQEKESPQTDENRKSRPKTTSPISRESPIKRQSPARSKSQSVGTYVKPSDSDTGTLNESRPRSEESSKSRSKSPPEEKVERPSLSKSVGKENKEIQQKGDISEQDLDKSKAVEETPRRGSQTRQENRQLSSRMSTASFISEPPRPIDSKRTKRRGWTAVAVLPAANKWKKRTREGRANRSRSRPLRGLDQQPYVTKSGRVIHPNSVHDSKYEDIQETRALSRMSRMDMASQLLQKENDDARSERSEHSPKDSRGGRASRQSKISIA